MYKTILTIIFSFIVLQVFSQKAGAYLGKKDPIAKNWKLKKGQDVGAVLIVDVEFIFIKSEGQRSMMASLYEEESGYGCPTYFKLSKNEKLLFFEVSESCALGLSAEDKLLKIPYRYDENKKELILIVKEKEFIYIPK